MPIDAALKEKLVRTIILAIIGWYLLLIVVHYFNQRPLWNDEQCILLNIQQMRPSDLFHNPLLSLQEFPRTYLYIIQQFSSHFNFQLLALRFFPFGSMLTAFFIWIYLAQKQIPSLIGLLTFFLCWAASAPLIYYAAELKQYSMDVLVSSLFLLFLYHQKTFRKHFCGPIYALILLLLAVSGLLSYPAFFFMPLPLYNLWMDAKEDSRWRPLVWLYLLSCLGCFLAVYYFDFRVSTSNIASLKVYWKNYFISFDSPVHFFRSVQEGLNGFISRWFVEKPRWIRMAARFFVGIGFLRLLLGAWPIFKKEGLHFMSIHSIAGIVFLEYFILSAFKNIAFGVPRVSLFFAPMLLFLTVDALQWLKQHNGVLYALAQYPFLIYLLYISLGIARMIFAGDLGAEPFIWRQIV